MHRRAFCKSTLGVAVAATLPGYGSISLGTDVGSTISAMSVDGDELSLKIVAVKEFAESLAGNILLPSDNGYNEAKLVWNGMFDSKKPAMVVRCASQSDVVNAVNFARESNLLLSVKCGGHSLPGKSTSDGGMMIDLSQLKTVSVDAQAMTMRAGGGSLLGHLDNASSAQNTITTTGIVSHTGVGGFTLGGGVGRTDRSTGLAVDNLLAATIVTASGEVLHASEEENADLFWGLRGGGGNFGVVTEFVYRLHHFNPIVYGGTLFFDADREFLEFYAELHETMPDEANIEPQFVPDENGKPQALVEIVWNGDHAQGEKVLAPMLAYPGYRHGKLAPFPYREIQTSADAMTAHGMQAYLKSSFLKELTPDVIDIMMHYVWEGKPTWSWFQHMGGATNRVAADATAFRHRDTAFNYGANYPRLAKLKRKYDPTNLFRLNANIKPA